MEERWFEFDRDRVLLVRRLRREISDERVLDVMSRVPRHLFVPLELRPQAYEDRPLPIGEGQTISQPFIVALMTQALSVDRNSLVLEIGTGSGYQTAILAELARWVVSVERVPSLAERARNTLLSLGCRNVEIHIAGTALGWMPSGPFDRIMVTAAAPYVPQALLDQLKDGGSMIIPVGSRSDQELISVVKQGDRISRRALSLCRFVPLIGEQAWQAG